jgi:ribosome-binding factor A
MPREFSRGRKVADLIQRELAILIQREVKDPRIGMVTVNEASVSRDLAYADVYFTVLPAENTAEVEEILNQAGGFLRSELAKILNTRTTPRLRFHYDPTIENGARLSKAIDAARARDRDEPEDVGTDGKDNN